MNKKTFRAALAQLRSGRDVAANLEQAGQLIREAAAGGADYVQTPENTSIMELDRARLLPQIQPEAGNSGLERMRELALELRIWLHIGSMGFRLADDRIANRSLLIAPDASIAARYDKIHMFDVDLPGGESYRESRNYAPGSEAVLAALPWGRLGMTICYDLRFAYLYRLLAQAGAEILSVPAAFTAQTGRAHWHILLRARAIETGCFVFAAAQGGMHENGRATYGHSLIISPWGEIIAEAGEEPGVIYADIDLAQVGEARARVPALTHDREVTLREFGPVEANALPFVLEPS